MSRRNKVTSVALAGALAFTAVAAAATKSYEGTLEGQKFAEVSMRVKTKEGKPKKASFTFQALVVPCEGNPPGAIASSGVENMPVKKEGGRFVFEGTNDEGSEGETVHVEGTVKANLKRVTGTLDYTRILDEAVCNIEDVAFTASKA
jgi:hypothetical protein